MFRTKISGFIKKNKDKIGNLGTKLIIVAIAVLIATIMLSFTKKNSSIKTSNNINTYKPTETVIKGSDVSQKQYNEDTNKVDMFIKYCNEKDIDKAYDILSNDCKEKLYPTIEIFKNGYYNSVFSTERKYNLQAWISTDKYTVYKIRYTNNMLATGEYNKDEVYQDYITLIKDSNEEKVSVGQFVIREEENKLTKNSLMDATVIKKNVYVDDEEYEINITNNTNKTILLDDLDSSKDIKLIASSGEEYKTYINKIFTDELVIEPNKTKKIIIRFKKQCSSNNKSKYIEFSNVIKDYNEYLKNSDYKDTLNVKIKL